MDQDYKLEIIDRDGWVKEQALEKPINYIGSGSRSDIVLEPARGGGVAALHAQLIVSNQGQAAQVSYAAPGDSGCQLVNLSDSDILLAPHLPTNASEGAGLGAAGEQTLSPRSVVNLTDGMVFRLGEFRLIFHGGGQAGADQAAGFARSGQYIGLNVSLPQTRLAPHQSLEGALTVSNLGDRGGVQIELDLEGLEPDCYDLEPGPVLASGAEREVLFRLHHRGNKPLAGDYHITIRASAPRAYPGDEVYVSAVIRVLPFYQYQVRLLSLAEAGPAPQTWEPRTSKTEAAPPSPAEDWWAPSPGVAAGLPAAPAKKQVLESQVESPELRARGGQAETVPPAQVKTKSPPRAHPPDEKEAEAAQAQAGLPVQAADAERQPDLRMPGSEVRVAEEPPLPAAAGPPLESEAEPTLEPLPIADGAEVGSETVPDAGAWGEVPAAEERPVLKLKASPGPETEAEGAPESEPASDQDGVGPPESEDWWAPADKGGE